MKNKYEVIIREDGKAARVMKSTLSESGRLLHKRFLSSMNGRWVKVPEGRMMPEECEFPIDVQVEPSYDFIVPQNIYIAPNVPFVIVKRLMDEYFDKPFGWQSIIYLDEYLDEYLGEESYRYTLTVGDRTIAIIKSLVLKKEAVLNEESNKPAERA